MKQVRLLALCGLALALAAPAAQAQGGGGGRGGRGMTALLEGITLTPEQKTKVDSIVAKYRAEMPPMQQGQPLDSTARAKRMELMQKQQADVKAVLTPEQVKTFEENIGKMRRPPGGL